jgi:hypothetical protein
MSFKGRNLLLSLMALLLLGSVAAETACAEAGPFFKVRKMGSAGTGEKLSESNTAEVRGEGSEQVITSTVAESPLEVTAKSVQTKGIIYNNARQGVVKAQLEYSGLRLAKPELKACEVKINSNNEIKQESYLAWKWNGQKKQLEENPKTQQPGMIFTPKSLAEGQAELPEGTLLDITLSGEGCGVVKGTFPMDGNLSVAIIKPANLEEWSAEVTTASPGWTQVHFWNGKEFIGGEPNLKFGKSEAAVKDKKKKIKVKVKAHKLGEEEEGEEAELSIVQ